MSTEKQRAANRRNATKSTGPKTDAGKQTTRLNSLKHGLAAQTIVLPFESQADYDALEASLLADLAPQGPTETLLVQRFAQKQWLVQRLAKTEAAWLHTLFQAHYAHGVQGAKNPKSEPQPYEGLALCMLEVGPGDPRDLLHQNFFRYRAQIENEYQRALRALERAGLFGRQRRPTPTIQTPNPEIGSAPEPSKSAPKTGYTATDHAPSHSPRPSLYRPGSAPSPRGPQPHRHPDPQPPAHF